MSQCLQSEPGHYVQTVGSTSQTPCQPGAYFAETVTTGCISAALGFFVDPADATTQQKCEAGTYQSRRGQTSCTKAPAGSFVNVPGATTPIKCSPGTYQPLVGATSCIKASVNFYVPTAGEVRQTPCPANSAQPLTGQTDCNFVDEPRDISATDTESPKNPVMTSTTMPRPGSGGASATTPPAPTTTSPLEKPTLPVVAKSVKIGKSVTISAPGGKTAQGVVVVASTSTATCTVRETAAGFSITGAKVGSCRIKVTAIGNSRFLTLTTEFRVAVTK
jgi:hypothetical protein